jgi:hypothetical protein
MVLVLAVGSSACLGQAPTGAGINNGGGPVGSNPGGALGDTVGGNQGDQTGDITNNTSGNTETSFDHENSTDPFAVLQRIQSEGTPEVSTRMHSCQKIRYSTVGRILTQLGVDMNKMGARDAATLYRNGGSAMGAPNFGARISESIELTTAGAAKLFDIFTSAAPEIIASMEAKGTPLFDSQGRGTASGMSILVGAPVTQAQLDLFNSALTSASSAAIGRTVAVASLLSAIHTCE